MELYKKILKFLIPYWKQVVLSIVLTFCYVLLNNLSLWVSVDFIGELFPKSQDITSVIPIQKGEISDVGEIKEDPASNSENETSPDISEEEGSQIEKLAERVELYHIIKYKIKSILVQETQQKTLLVVCLVIIFSFIFKNIFDYFRKVINRLIQVRIINNMRNEIQDTVMHLPLSYFNENHTANITSILFNDVKSVRQVLNNTFGKLVLTPIQIISYLVILFLISWRLSLITLIIVPVSGLLIVKIGQSMRRKSRRVFQQLSVVVSHFQEAVSGIRIVKAFTAESREVEKFKDANKKFYRIQSRAVRLGQATSPLNEICGVLILVSLLWYGGNLVYAGAFDAEDFIRFLIFLFATFQPLREFSGLNNILQRGLAAAERIFGLINEDREVYEKPDSIHINHFEKAIHLNQVSFQYSEKGPWVLRDIQLEIKKGETVAFVGHSGSGKSTLVNLIPRFYDTTQGHILIDNVDVRDCSLMSLRHLMGIVTQETYLFNDTIWNNIAYGVDDVSEEQILDAARVANVLEFVDKLDEGFEATVGERGVNLSGGQKQRLSIARAVLKNPPILILDEATSSLDTQSERLVQEAIDQLMKNRTVLVIAHRLSTIIHADKIVVLDEGKIVGIGTHEALLEICPLYKNLYEIQFNSELDDDN